jgi:cell division protein FtsL
MARRAAPRGPLALALCIGAVAAVALFHVWVRLRVVQLGYAIGAESRTARETAEANRALHIEVEWLKSPARIEHLAKDKLHMQAPDPANIKTVSLSSVGDERGDRVARRD